MLTHETTVATSIGTPERAVPAAQKVVIVNGSAGILELVETVLDAGQYDVVFVESTEHAYSHIKRLSPHLIIVCLDIDDMDGFQVLSMLKLDSETKGIPVVTCTVTSDDDVAPDEPAERPDDVFSEPPAIC